MSSHMHIKGSGSEPLKFREVPVLLGVGREAPLFPSHGRGRMKGK